MPRLVVKLPFSGGARGTRSSNSAKVTPVEANKKKKSSKERVQKFRQMLKENEEKLKVYKEKKLFENKCYRKKVNELRLKDPAYDEQIKAKERLRKQKQRQKKAKNQAKLKLDEQQKADKLITSNQKTRKQKTERRKDVTARTRKSAERVNKILPKESEAWARTVSHLIKNATPKRKSVVLQNAPGLTEKTPTDKIADILGINKVGRPKKEHSTVKKKLAFSKGNMMWNSKRSYKQYLARKNKATAVSKPSSFKKKWTSKVEAFLTDNSRVMPNKKDTIIMNGKPVAKRHLLCSKRELFSEFKKVYPNFGRSFTIFYRMIPRNYKKLDLTCRRVCVCVKDYNLEQKVNAMNHLAKQKFMHDLVTSVRTLSNITVCPFNDLPERSCSDRTCNNCGTYSVKTVYDPLLETSTKEKVKFHQWETIKETYTQKNGKTRTVKRWVQKQRMLSAEDTVTEIVKDFETFTGHLFRSDFQHKIQKQLMSNIPLNHAVAVMDFSQNISLEQQDEIESAHWNTRQVTLHPIFIVRHAPESTDETPVLMQESLIILSDSLDHTADSVFVFTKQLIHHIYNNPGPSKLKVLHRFSDNCAVQYKSKLAFGHISQIEEEENIKVFYHFTESGHGKGPSDGLGAAIKAKLQRMILAGKVINNAYEVYLALVQNQPPSNQTIVYVPSKQLSQRKPNYDKAWKTVSGTQSYHMVSKSNTEQGALQCSDLSCSCLVCLSGHQGPCFLQKYRHEPEICYLLHKTKKPKTSYLWKESCGDGFARITPYSCDVLDDSILSYQEHHQKSIDSLEYFKKKIHDKAWQVRGTTPADGNCFFWAISDQLDRIGIQTFTHHQLRQKIVSFLRDMTESEQAEVDRFLTTDIKTYIQTMEKDGTYADHVALYSLSKALGVTIKVVQAESPDVVTGHYGNQYLVIGYIPEISHYVSLEPISELELLDGDYVLVQLSSPRNRTTKQFVAQVLQTDDDEIQLKYMTSKEKNCQAYHVWTSKQDISWENKNVVIKKLTAKIVEEISTNRLVYYKFDL